MGVGVEGGQDARQPAFGDRAARRRPCLGARRLGPRVDLRGPFRRRRPRCCFFSFFSFFLRRRRAASSPSSDDPDSDPLDPPDSDPLSLSGAGARFARTSSPQFAMRQSLNGLSFWAVRRFSMRSTTS